MNRRYALRDEQGSTIENLLPGLKESVGVTAKDNRLFVEAVLYRITLETSGILCIIIMSVYLYKKTVYHYLYRTTTVLW